MVGGLLALLVVGLLVFVSCGVPGGGDSDEQEALPELGELDDQARAACELYTPVADDVRSGELTGPPLYRSLQDVYNVARQSQTEGFADAFADLINASIVEDDQARLAQLERIDEACDA